MTAIQLELRAIRLNKTLSDETPAYSAALHLNGKRVADLANHGHGGCDMVRWLDRSAEAVISAHFRAMPAETVNMGGAPFQLQPDLESWAHGQVWDSDLIKTLRRNLSRKVIGLREGKEYSWKLAPDQLDAPTRGGKTAREIILERNPGVLILNGLPEAEAVAAVKRAASL